MNVLHGCACALLWVGVLPGLSAEQAVDRALARGARLQQEGNLEAAVAAFREAVEAAPERVDALASLSLAYLRMGRVTEALPGLRRSREALPEHVGVAYYLGLAYFQDERHASARSELEWVLERQPENHQARHLFGLSLLKLGDLQGGIEALETVVRADRSNRQAVLTLSSAYLKASMTDRAEDMVTRYLQRDGSPEALLVRGSLELAHRNHQRALELFEGARSSGQALPTLHSQTGVALLYAGQRERAEREFRAELAVDPSNYNANAFLGWLLQQDGASEEALRMLQTANRLDGDDAGVQYLLAQVLASQGNWEEGARQLRQVVASQPDFIPAQVMLARAYAKLKRPELFRQQREIIDELNARQQERDLQGVDQLYDGRVLSLPDR